MRLFWKMGVRVCRVIGLYFSLSPRRGGKGLARFFRRGWV